MLNLHAKICCCINTATYFLSCDIKGTQKTHVEGLVQVVFKCISENHKNENLIELVTFSPQKSLNHAITTTNTTSSKSFLLNI